MRKLGLAVALYLMALPASAALFIAVQEVGGDVQAEASGSLDLTGMTFTGNVSGSFGNIMGSLGNVRFGAIGGAFVSTYSFGVGDISTGLTNFGTGPFTVASSSSGGPAFGVMIGALPSPTVFAPVGFTSGALNGTITLAGHTFASLGLVAQTITITLPNDSIVMQLGAAANAVPEINAGSATAPLALLLFALLLRSGMRRAPEAPLA